jgi:hypothetical protein
MIKYLALIISVFFLVSGCGKDKKVDAEKKSGKTAELNSKTKPQKNEAKFLTKTKSKTLLVAQSEFAKDKDGKWVVPHNGALLLINKDNGKWKVRRIEDKDSNVLHKAAQYGKNGILTIGANEAMLKLWNKNGDKWIARTLWHPKFGGKNNRLREFEEVDFDGDGRMDLAIATHDMGVVAVVWNKGDKWQPQEVDRRENTFVHEIEVGDLDKNGKMEFYATPSKPNTVSGHGQGGGILRYEWDGAKFNKSVVVQYDKRHIKEIMVADVDGDGTKELYAALEAQMGEGGKMEIPVEIYRYDYKNGKFEPSKVAQIKDRFCRFLVSGDIDGDGHDEIIASAFTAGVWVIKRDGDKWNATCIDSDSGGFEHAAYLADIDGDKKLELYVADDNHGLIKQYVYNDGSYNTSVIYKRLIPGQAMVWNITVADF